MNAAWTSRLDREARRLNQLEESSLASDDISKLTLSQLSDKLLSEKAAPGGFKTGAINEALLIYLLSFDVGLAENRFVNYS